MSPPATLERGHAAGLVSGGSACISSVAGVSTQPEPGRRCCDVHCNSLWSVWYGLLVVGFEAFIIYQAVAKFMIYIALPWPDGKQPYLELNIFVGLVGAGVVLLPFYLISFLFKIGNLANDGYKLGFQLSACAMDPPSVLARSSGVIRNAWHHGGPTAAFIHLVSAFFFVLPKIFMEARLVEVGFLSQDWLWKTDLDWLVPHQDRLVILNFLTGGAVNATSTTTQAPYHHPAAQIREYLSQQEPWWPISPEFANYALALIVYAVRYPAVFWNTNKAFSFIFSLQLFANALQNLLGIGALGVMYKVHVMGPQNVLHKYEPFLLNAPICLLLYLLSCVIITASSCVLYMYGYHKFMTFVETERRKERILIKEGHTTLWAYFPHCAAMCVLIALAVCNAPLLYDFTLIYKGSLDGAVLTCVIGTILHLFTWIVLWLFLTVKQNWTFKLRVTVGHAVVRSARSIKLLNDVDLHNDGGDQDAMMIVAFGKSFTVSDPAPKKLIMNTLARAAIERDKAQEMEDGQGENAPLLDSNGAASQSSRPNMASPALSGKQVTFDREARAAGSTQRPPGEVQPQDVTDDCCDDLPPPPGHNELQEHHRQHQQMQEPLSPHHQAHSPHSQQQQQQQQQQQPSVVVPAQQQTAQVPRGKTQMAIIHNPEVQDVLTPRSNRSVDSGLPHDDITPKSDSLSSGSSTTSPHQQQQQQLQQQQSHPHMNLTSRELQQQHRKSTSMDDINIGNGLPGSGQHQQHQQQWKSCSLQRGMAPPASSSGPADGTLVIRRKASKIPAAGIIQDDEDPYGRCLNMKLTSFSENGQPLNPRDPRIIDLSQASQPSSVSSTPRQGSPVPMSTASPPPPPLQAPPSSQFNTLPSQMGCGPKLQHTNSGPAAAVHNTLPARVNGHSGSPSNGGLATSPTSSSSSSSSPGGRHFKHFDHRKMNPMANIEENPYGISEAVYASARPTSAAGLIVQKTPQLPHLPAELRHTNYSAQPAQPPAQQHKQLVHPQVLEHHRDSANFSLTSSDSG